MTEIQKRLFELSDKEYAVFQAKLNPVVSADRIIGVRLPALRKLAKEFSGSPQCEAFLKVLPHDYFDEDMLHSILLENSMDYEKALNGVEAFLPYVDNWAVCDALRPKIFARHRAELLPSVKKWIDSDEAYACRFGIEMLMTHYLDAAFEHDYLALPAIVTSEEYYVRMAVAWYYATALAKQWDAAIPYIEQHRLPEWTHRKTIRKAVESFRISAERKTYLKSLR